MTAPQLRDVGRVVLGGGGRRMLSLAAREADIVSVNYNLNEGRVNRNLVRTGFAEATDEKLAWVSNVGMFEYPLVPGVTPETRAAASGSAPGAVRGVT